MRSEKELRTTFIFKGVESGGGGGGGGLRFDHDGLLLGLISQVRDRRDMGPNLGTKV